MNSARMSTTLGDASREEIQRVMAEEARVAELLAERLLTEIEAGAKIRSLNVSRYEHSLQTATRAYRDSAGEDLVVAALLHDIGDSLAPLNHGDLAAAILRPYVSDEIVWTVRYHPVFQLQYYADKLDQSWSMPDELASSPFLPTALRFCGEWDQRSFDPDYDTLPLSHFEPMLRRVLARSPGA